jgi:hypothetical protein
MITSKTELSEFCKAIRFAITESGDTIKLASVRERVAQSLSYNSVNDLLANLPISLTNDFWNALPKAFDSEHDIDFRTPPWGIRYLEHFPLNADECGIIWHRLCLHFELTDYEDIKGSEMRPDGQGEWLFQYEVPYITDDMQDFEAYLDPVIAVQGDEYTLFELHLQCINTERSDHGWTQKTKYSELEVTTLSQFARLLGIDVQDLPQAIKRIESEYPIEAITLTYK